MVKYILVYGSGLAWNNKEEVILDSPTTDFGLIVDTAIDQIEARGEMACFLDQSELDDYGEDEYIIGGNHGLALYHHGTLNIRMEGLA